ncbi:MAG: SDR family oxidoreductase [Planctomycetes bacterium]|nr:SDR family oxidoreductase [Planctomycetota bacterium]
MILVTGGAGYIGCILVPLLAEKGYSVRVFDKLFFGDGGLKNLGKRCEIVQGDLRDFDPQILDGVSAVIHLAGLSNDPTAEYNPTANHEMNTVATDVLARRCKERGIKRFSFATTCSIYDLGFAAEDFMRTEESEVEPRAAYATSNYEAERILLKLADDNFHPVLLRQGTVFGWSPRMRYDLVVNTMMKDALMKGALRVDCGGEMWRPLVDIEDVARAHIVCIEAPAEKIKGRIFNIVQKNYRILELAHHVKRALADLGVTDVTINVDYSHFNTRSYRVDGTLIRRELGFEPKIDVQTSVRNMLTQIRENKQMDFMNPRYYNIQWMSLLDEMEGVLKSIGGVFTL